ncbi:cytochrome c oxidase assembly factor CtaG [Lentibacillus saliphilus]|uniref:cytochrome c oxidase assembly factor CtaG n=1 Tax=Lentibacillus saliphilus TaxID=2737028 RepID=UPI001C2F6EE6|nr:cytochrome c oxidase assembly factor CtaG [Lentibacillus saliphilus]
MWLDLQIFGFRALWSPYFFLFVLTLGIAYYLITGPYRKSFSTEAEKPTSKQQVYFYTALILLYVVKGGPVDLLSHIMLTAHMTQMAIYYLVFPILILKSVPEWIWIKVTNLSVIKPIFKLVTKPLISLLLFNALFSLYHLPAVFNFAKSGQLEHTSMSLLILFSAFVMWWPIVAPIKQQDTISPLLKMGYIVGGSVLITPACVLIIFSDVPLYSTYSSQGAWIQALSLCVPGNVLDGLQFPISGPEMFSSMNILEDQQLGGIVMKIMQEIVYGTMIGRIFFKWFNKESLKVDPLPSHQQAEHVHTV